MNNLSRSLYGNASTVGCGKSGPLIDKIVKAIQKDEEQRKQHNQNLKMLYHPSQSPMFGKVRKPRIYKKKTVIDPDVLAKISKVDVDVVEKALKGYLKQKLKDIVSDIGQNGKTVTLGSVLKTIREIQ